MWIFTSQHVFKTHFHAQNFVAFLATRNREHLGPLWREPRRYGHECQLGSSKSFSHGCQRIKAPTKKLSILVGGKIQHDYCTKKAWRLLDAQPFNQSYMQWMQRVVSSDFTDRNNGRKDGPIMFPCSDGVPIVNICFRRRVCAEIPNQALFSTKTMTINNRECNWRSSKAYFSITNANPSIIYNGPLMQS